MSNTQDKHLCQNCHCLIAEDENYCSICGQKKIERPLSVRELVHEFFHTVISSDSKLTRTIIPLFFSPGKLTIDYLEGRREKYFSPVKLFLFFLTLNLVTFAIWGMPDLKINGDDNPKEIFKKRIYRDSICNILQKNIVNKADQIIVDSICATISEEETILDSIVIGFGDNQKLISYQDMVQLEVDSIAKKYEITSLMGKVALKQGIKAGLEPDAFARYLLGHQSWAIFFALPLLAFLLQLLFIRHKKYYVEHLIFVLHLHAFAFALLTFMLLWIAYTDSFADPSNPILFSFLSIALYFLIMLYRVYHQRLLKTLLKAFIFAIGYCFILTISLLFLIITSFVLF